VVRLLVAFALALAVLGGLAARAQAHATLESTTPERGAALERAPGEVVLRFSEPVEIAFGAVQVFDAGGAQVAEGDAHHPGGDGSAVAVRLPRNLPDGGYTVTFRVVSADSHPVSGGFTFGIGAGAAAPAAGVAELLSGQEAGDVTAVAFSAVRAVQYGAITLGIGVLAVLLAAWLPALRSSAAWAAGAAAFHGRAELLLLAAAAAGVASALLGLGLQTAVAGGTSLWSAVGDVGTILETRFGFVWGIGAVVWAFVLVAVTIGRATAARRVPRMAGGSADAPRAPVAAPGWLEFAAPALLALALLPGLGGHAGVQEPVAVLLPANVLHVLAAGAWIGGIATLVLALPAATRRLEPDERTRLLAAVLGRFSTLALIAVVALLAGGIVQSLIELRTLADLVDTAFGRAILVKIGLVCVLLGLGWLNRSRILPALDRPGPPGRPGLLLRRSLRAEAALGVAALVATGALAGYTPPESLSAGPFSGSAEMGPARAELTVDPARAGPNELHLYLFSSTTGDQYDAVREMTITAAQPDRGIEPIRLRARKGGPGHYLVGAAPLSPPGDWEIEIAARITEFDELRTSFTVPIE
jgi:copper transport protein